MTNVNTFDARYAERQQRHPLHTIRQTASALRRRGRVLRHERRVHALVLASSATPTTTSARASASPATARPRAPVRAEQCVPAAAPLCERRIGVLLPAVAAPAVAAAAEPAAVAAAVAAEAVRRSRSAPARSRVRRNDYDSANLRRSAGALLAGRRHESHLAPAASRAGLRGGISSCHSQTGRRVSAATRRERRRREAPTTSIALDHGDGRTMCASCATCRARRRRRQRRRRCRRAAGAARRRQPAAAESAAGAAVRLLHVRGLAAEHACGRAVV